MKFGVDPVKFGVGQCRTLLLVAPRRTPEQLIVLARAAAEGERLRQVRGQCCSAGSSGVIKQREREAAELCTEGLDLLWSKPKPQTCVCL